MTRGGNSAQSNLDTISEGFPGNANSRFHLSEILRLLPYSCRELETNNSGRRFQEFSINLSRGNVLSTKTNLSSFGARFCRTVAVPVS